MTKPHGSNPKARRLARDRQAKWEREIRLNEKHERQRAQREQRHAQQAVSENRNPGDPG